MIHSFHIMYSACKLNNQGDNIEPWCTPFPILNQSVVLCLVLTVAFWPAYRFLRRHVRWSGTHLLRNFPQFFVIHTVKGISIVSDAEVDIFSETLLLFYDSTHAGNLISCSSAFSKCNLYIWNFLVHILLKPSLKDFEHNLASTWNEHNCTHLTC